jgi:hypothetical protein
VGPPNCCSASIFGWSPNPSGGPPDIRPAVWSHRTYRRTVRPRGRRRRTYRRTLSRTASNGQISTPPINTPSPSWDRVRTSPTIVHL